MRARVLLSLTLSLMLSLAAAVTTGCAPARPAPGALSPVGQRLTNASRAADLRTIDAWDARRGALVALVRLDAGADSATAANRAAALMKAGAWLALARESYVAQPDAAAADAALARARRIIEQQERGDTGPTVAGGEPTVTHDATPSSATNMDSSLAPAHAALMARARALHAGPGAERVAGLLDEMEVALARADAAGERDGTEVGIAAPRVAGTSAPQSSVIPAFFRRRAPAPLPPAATPSCALAPNLAYARRLLGDAEASVARHVAMLQADSAEERRLALLREVRADARVRMHSVHFALDSASLSAASRAVLDRVAAALRSHAALDVTLEGHTDPRGDAEYNLDLSRRRAASVRDYLASTGLDMSRVVLVGRGWSLRRSLGFGARDYALDRRVIVQFSLGDGTELADTDDALDLQIEDANRVVRGRAATAASTRRAAAGKPGGRSRTSSVSPAPPVTP